ncbi:MAG: metallophosphoesterase family protein [Planctomycetota bacterium]|nr:metallophosphoesterase family protein [Planctomycetota bacterium]
MPRQAIISDIHGNLVAFQRALKDCEDQKVDQIVCIGDIAGYGPDPIPCVDIVRERCTWSLCGNHDVALFMNFPIGFNKVAREAIEWQRTQLQPRWYSLPAKRRRWAWLQNLQPSRLEDRTLYVHASPRDPILEYVEEGDVADMGFGPSQKIVEIFEKIPWLSFCGHSHRPGVVTEDFIWIKPHELDGYSYDLPPGRKTLVNIGSVGQPRDGNPDLCYVIHDTERKRVTFRRLAYDVAAAQERFKRVPQLHEKTWKRLSEGR